MGGDVDGFIAPAGVASVDEPGVAVVSPAV